MQKMSKSESGKLGQLAGCNTRRQQQKDRITEYSVHPSHCGYCDTSLSYTIRHNKFCSRTCAATYNNLHRPNTKEPAHCRHCNVLITSDKKTRTFCSTKCTGDYKHLEKINQWLSGEISGSYNGKISGVLIASIRKYLIKAADNKCVKCQWGETNISSGNVPLEIDHIDGNSSNNTAENLQVLCPNCHSLTPTYKSLNTGNGRKGR